MTMFLAPFAVIADLDGSPLDAGFLFLGEYGKDPERFPVEVFWDSDFTIPAAQPIRTRNGYPARNGSPGKIFLKNPEYSIAIKSKKGISIVTDFFNKGGLYDGSISTWSGLTQEEKNKQILKAEDFNLIGDSITDQSARFAEIESVFIDAVIDLQGGTYKVSTIPTGNKYANGWFFTSEKIPSDYVTEIRSNNKVIALGDGAAASANGARNCIAIGQDAMKTNTRGRHNIAIGISALHFLNGPSTSGFDGTRNIAIGGNTGRFASTASRNILVGRDTAHNITNAHMNIILGNAAVMGDGPNWLVPGEIINQTPLTPGSNIVIGTEAGKYLNANETVLIGHQAGKNLKADSFVVGIGAYAFEKHQSDRSYWGKTELSVNISGTYTQSGSQTITVVTTGAHGLSTGFKVWLRFLTGAHGDVSYNDDIWFDVNVVNSTTFTIQSPVATTASGNCSFTRVSTNTNYSKNSGQSVGVGYSVGNGPDNYRSVGVGHQAGASGLGTENTAIGFRTIFTYSTGVGNTAIGAYSQADGRGSGNASLGVLTLNVNTGSGNTAAGANSMQSNTTGSNNTGVGAATLRTNTTGNNNTGVGVDALRYTQTGADFNFSNCSALGYQAYTSGNNQVQLGDSSTTTYVYGTVQNRSDERDKADIRDTELGLDFINSLRPVDYKWDMREDYIEAETYTEKEWQEYPFSDAVDVNDLGLETKIEDGKRWILREVEKVRMIKREKDGSKKRTRYHHGFIAQEVPGGFGGYQDHSIHDGDDVLSLGYDEFIAPLVKAVQELTQKVKDLEAEKQNNQ